MPDPADAPNVAIHLLADASVDLHTHTIFSDGHWQPDALVAHLAERGFRLAAIADHDRFDHLPAIQAQAAERGLTLLPAVEVTTNWHGRVAHLLCYAHALPQQGALARLTAATRDGMRENNAAVAAELGRRGYAFPRQAEVLAASGGRIERPIDNARLLVAHGYVATMETALALIADAGYHIVSAPLAEAVAAAHADGALALIAHPGRRDGEVPPYEPELLATLLDELPLDGIEAYYAVHTPEQTAAYLALARQRGLLVSAGSDSHGPRQRLPIAYPARDVAALLERLGLGPSCY
ncbi:MAG TPA: PHP domain-containing protein [Ktedonobacterales bacterium]|nr:PHP domain-containing protein [Ktedonobacterales bacterium]